MSTLMLSAIVGFISGIIGGSCIYALFHWANMRFQLALDYRITDLERRLIREMRLRGAETARKSKTWEQDLLEKAKEEGAEPELTLKTWKEKGFMRT